MKHFSYHFKLKEMSKCNVSVDLDFCVDILTLSAGCNNFNLF